MKPVPPQVQPWSRHHRARVVAHEDCQPAAVVVARRRHVVPVKPLVERGDLLEARVVLDHELVGRHA
jgi:hypothetical protein